MRQLINYLSIIILLALNWCVVSFAQEIQAKNYTGIITANSVNIRSGPNKNFEILKKAHKNELILVQGEEMDWCRIKLPADSNAYVKQDFINFNEGSILGTITNDRVNVRADKGIQYNIVGQLQKNDVVEIIRKEGEWFKIFPKENCSAWVHKKYVKYYNKENTYLENEKKYLTALNLLEQALISEKKDLQNLTIDSKPIEVIQKYEDIINKYPDIRPAKIAQERLNNLNTLIEENIQKQKELLYQPELPLAVGKIIECGHFFNRLGTHKLINNKKTSYYLKSEKINLNEYVYYDVQIWGEILNSLKSKIPVIEVQRIEKMNAN